MEKIKVMLSGLYVDDNLGKMARLIAHAIARDERFDLLGVALGGEEINDHLKDGQRCACTMVDNREVKIVPPSEHKKVLYALKTSLGDGSFYVVDFTHPLAINENVKMYCELGVPFVAGTTGGDREELVRTIEASNTIAVIAPNMAPQIVGFQAMMEYGAKTFPGLFSDYTLQIKESHQAGKADTSGTAKAMVKYFNAMGVYFNEGQIEKERDVDVQVEEWGIPEKYLSGHGWHTYTLTSPDGKVKFEFTHNINGRDIYADPGVKDAVIFLDKVRCPGCYSMIDVLKGPDAVITPADDQTIEMAVG